MYDGLTIKNGRLINNRPNGVTGIQEAVQIKSDLKKAKKLEMYSEAVSLGIQKAENVEDIKEMFLK
jgi:tryptophan synthase alpha subunit